VRIDLAGTPLHALAFAEIAEGVDARRFALAPVWLSCRSENGIWHGAGDETKLERILGFSLRGPKRTATEAPHMHHAE
jgi:hypothetical protein